MKICYYPGCTLKTQAKDLDLFARKSAEKLGIEMEEIPDWQCCGGVYPTAKDEIATKLSSVRTLDYAKHNGGLLLTLCSACYNVIKRVNYDIANDKIIAERVNNYMALEDSYNGETKVIHYLEMLRDYVGFENIKKAVVNPINEKIGAYYGCLLLRPSKVMAFDNPENPSILEEFIKAIGGEAISYPFRNECCGAYVSFKSPELPVKQTSKILKSAEDKGAKIVVTACPLCYYNLTKNNNTNVKVVYFTELLAKALGVKE